LYVFFLCYLFSFLLMRRASRFTLFPYTTLFRSGQFRMALMTAGIVGLLFAFPYAFWEIWRFVKPGLKYTERKAARGAVFFVTVLDRKSTRLNSSHVKISYAVFCLKKKKRMMK